MSLLHSGDIPGYTIDNELYRGNHTVVVRGRRRPDGHPVVLKTLQPSGAPFSEALRLHHEYEIIRGIQSTQVIQAVGFERHEGVHALVLEDFGGLSLNRHLATTRVDILSFLQIAIQLAEGLKDIHAANVIHKDINPSNIVINPSTGQVKIIDFGIASPLPMESARTFQPRFLEGTLAYISPEQTGRMNRSLDYRSDFYSLGVTLYEMLIGWLPFPSGDPMEMLHSHIARIPRIPSELNPALPRALSAIVMKLLAKTAEERYRSAAGLKHDLEECVRFQKERGMIPDLTPGDRDISDRFRIPERLYGREQEVLELEQAFERTSKGDSQLLLVSGGPGIGKSALVHEVQRSIVRHRGFFIAGKCDQFNRDAPYASLTQAFRGLISQLLASSPAELDVWRLKLKEALGPNGDALNGIVPGMELLVGDVARTHDLPAVEAQNRTNRALLSFVRALSRPEHPLVIFLDDLQWTDRASLRIIHLLLTDPAMESLLLIGAYRDDEVVSPHPLAVAIDGILEAKGTVHRITLAPLRAESLTHLLADTLQSDAAQCGGLSDLVASKTGANPFFVGEFLKALHQERLLSFNDEQRTWTWDLEAIRRKGITENVVALMTGKIRRLPEETQHLLRFAACLGNRFDLETLLQVSGEGLERIAAGLTAAIKEGLLLPMGDATQWMHGAEAVSERFSREHSSLRVDVSYLFAHDRIQQAAYSLIPAEEAPAVHYAIGQNLLRARTDRLFDVVEHLNRGKECLANEQERVELCRLTLAAGKKAKASAAFDPALQYCTAGLSLLREEDWTNLYDVARDLLMEQGECAYLTGSFELAEHSYDLALTRARTAADRGRIYGLMIDLFIHQGRIDLALETGIKGLNVLGVRLAPHPGRLTVLREMAMVRLRLRNRRIGDLIHLPEMTAEEPRVAMNILMSLFGVAYSLSQEMTALVVARMMNLTLRYGNTDVSAYAYGIYGLILRTLGAVSSGYALALLGLDVSDKFDNILLKGRCNFVVGCLHNHWHNHARTNPRYMSECHRCSAESGDLLYDSYAYSQETIVGIFTGNPLATVFDKATEYLGFVEGIEHKDMIHYFVLARQFILNLQGKTEGPATLTGEGFDEEAYVRELDKTGWTAPRMYYRALRIQLCYHHRLYPEALAVIEESSALSHALTGQVVEAEFVFYHSLTLAAACAGADDTRRRMFRAAIRSNQKKMKRWATYCPENFLHRWQLIAAEQARLEGDGETAMRLYDEAIAGARKQEYFQNEALANELAGCFYLGLGREKVARTYLWEARQGYSLWGAMEKVRQMENMYGLLASRTHYGSSAAGQTREPSTVTDAVPASMDLLSVLKASQALSGEIVFSRLLQTMMTIVLENAGAQRGVLVMERGNTLVVEAEHDVNMAAATVMHSLPVAQCERVCEGIVRYVARSHQTVVLHNAVEEGDFIGDPYILRVKPKSVLSMPIEHQGRLTGILYLENNLLSNAFTPARLEILRLLSSQIAVSMENARLYVQERELARMQEEVRLAAAIQRDLLPAEQPVVPGYEILGRNIPAQTVGGDYFDFIRITGERLAVTLGDVSGKGLPASLLMANLQAALRGQTLHNLPAAGCLARSNRLLYESTGPEKFATVFYAILDTGTHTLQYCNAGHEHPFLLSTNGTLRTLVTGGRPSGSFLSSPMRKRPFPFRRATSCSSIQTEFRKR